MTESEVVTRGSHGWREISRQRKSEIIKAITSGSATRGPAHIELDLTDRCNVDCYFCNQQDVRSKQQIPLEKVKLLIDELAASGLASVRLSGGGDPLFHREIVDVLDHLSSSRVVVDNLTTNGVALTDPVARRLVESQAREVIISLNAADPEDYQRMMQVRPELFSKVLENVRHLIAIKGERVAPAVVVQFLIDRENFRKLPEMYALGRSLGVDRVAINSVLEIHNARISEGTLLGADDAEAVRPYLEEIVSRDSDARLLHMHFRWESWNENLAGAYEKAAYPSPDPFPIAPSFRDQNGGCFFGWYTAAVTGTGDIYPCCMLISPYFEPLGNIHEGPFDTQWNGERFTTMRREMRDVLIDKRTRHSPALFQVLKRECVEPGLCWLKNANFRGDEEFYRELGSTLDELRKQRETGLSFRRVKRVSVDFFLDRPILRGVWDWIRDGSRPVRVLLKKKFGWDVTEHP